ncbi:NAD-dependent succinate-semialdehyde dehydrogenase [Microbacterium sp. Se5.02b]|uniref:NAD-dependent succinate-semialdehyde dehydrogenase n=1 Tax=Microbacterium sp. Se5.02b TaxID=2864103 RepID=UPI001C68A439|nr:NAD-dependent succinate-semialdehyde dehydrogenase [Microbacterium sp. Se5.02b]QYM63587.1 NAD-dependent succinate-semialdehyde dehydrogenase [Microbacterium sp. Se5.02b]
MTDYAVINPATGETLASFDTFTDEQIEEAVAAADEAHREWSRSTTVADRAALLRRAAELHRERREELADIFVREMGKPREAALGEVDFAADIAEYYADQAEDIMADQPIKILGDGSAIIRRSSLGPLVGIMPWNFPAYQIVRFAAPNLIVGNTILLKPAPQCPESSSAIEAIYHDAGFPKGAYQNILATNEQIADMIADPRVQGVSLTGSERAGAAVAEVAGRNLKKVALELGGSDPFIVLSTDDLDATVQAGVDARLDNNGQACNGAKRFIIVDELYDAFAEKFTAAMAAVEATDPMLDDTVLGPVSSEAAAENLQKQIDQAVEQGATLLTGGTRKGAFFAPTVLADVTPEMNVYREELFGPAAVVYRVADEDAAVALANDTTFGLGSYVFTTDAEQAERVADRIEAGMVYVNLVLADSPELPFGGIKRSGTSRELGHLAADEFVNKKLIRVG